MVGLGNSQTDGVTVYLRCDPGSVGGRWGGLGFLGGTHSPACLIGKVLEN